jgi:hypothetical protein
MNELIPSVVLIGLAIVAVLSFIDFHAPFGVVTIRYATLRDRYILAVAVYVTLALCIFFVIEQLLIVPVRILGSGQHVNQALRHANVPEDIIERVRATYFLRSISTASLGALLVMILAARLPGIRGAVDWTRTMIQKLGRYPESSDAVAAMLARQAVPLHLQAEGELRRELGRFAVPKRAIEAALGESAGIISSAAARILCEVCSLKLILTQMRIEPRLRGFMAGRDCAVTEIEKRYRRFMRRAAQSILLASDAADLAGKIIQEKDRAAVKALALDASELLCQEGNKVRSRVLRLVGDASLSCAWTRSSRQAMLSRWGYRGSVPRPLPVVPLIAVFCLDLLAAIVPVLLKFGPAESMSLRDAVVSGLAHAFVLSFAVFLGTVPKAWLTFARPSLYSLPWQSYLLFGVLAYVSGIIVTGAALAVVRLPSEWVAAHHPLVAAAFFSLLFPIMSTAVGLRLDRRLQVADLVLEKGRLNDALVVGLVMGATIFGLLGGIPILAEWYGLRPPPVRLEFRLGFGLVYGALGFVIGYVIPYTAEAHIDARRYFQGQLSTLLPAVRKAVA